MVECQTMTDFALAVLRRSIALRSHLRRRLGVRALTHDPRRPRPHLRRVARPRLHFAASCSTALPFRFMRWRLGLRGVRADTNGRSRRSSSGRSTRRRSSTRRSCSRSTPSTTRDGADGRREHPPYVTNDYVIELASNHPKMLFGASVHPYRKDAVAEVERCVKAGAVLLKWLPITQGFNPSDERCIPFYEALAHHKLPLLSHTGGEKSLPVLDKTVADPALLEPPLKRGVTVIAAHCGTRSALVRTRLPSDSSCSMAREHEHFYGDTSALNLPTRSYAWKKSWHDKVVREKLVHGSDWPILPVPPLRQVGLRGSVAAWRENNWIRRDVRIKERMGLDEAYWQRARTGAWRQTQPGRRLRLRRRPGALGRGAAAHLLLQVVPERVHVVLPDLPGGYEDELVRGDDRVIALGERGQDAHRLGAVEVGVLHDRPLAGPVLDCLERLGLLVKRDDLYLAELSLAAERLETQRRVVSEQPDHACQVRVHRERVLGVALCPGAVELSR